jgi:hypothetical protein
VNAALDEDAGAVFRGNHRLEAWETWGPGAFACFIVDSPPVSGAVDTAFGKCRRVARKWGLDGLIVVALWSLRGYSPGSDSGEDPMTDGCDATIDAAAFGTSLRGGPVVACWGLAAHNTPRAAEVAARLGGRGVELAAVAITGHGAPAHASARVRVLSGPIPFAYSPPRRRYFPDRAGI